MTLHPVIYFFQHYWQCIGFGRRLEVERNEQFIKLVACETDVSRKLWMENYVARGTWNGYMQYKKNFGTEFFFKKKGTSLLDFKTLAVFWMFYSFFWVIPRRLNFICRSFGTLSSIFIGGISTECSKHRHIKFRRWGITQKKQYNRSVVLTHADVTK